MGCHKELATHGNPMKTYSCVAVQFQLRRLKLASKLVGMSDFERNMEEVDQQVVADLDFDSDLLALGPVVKD